MDACKALVIGCGNIGAGYDIRSDDSYVLTHARALSRLGDRFEVAVADSDPAKAADIAETYGFETIGTDRIFLAAYDLVSIATPTATHYSFLERLIACNTPLIICEKPVSASLEELEKLAGLKQKGTSRVLVNYCRRYIPQYAELKKLLADDELHYAEVRYCRGFLNNCSHALDLLNFLTDGDMVLSAMKIHASEYDVFDNDPTISATFTDGNTLYNLVGFTHADYYIFEIDLFFARRKVRISDVGNTIELFGLEPEEKKFPARPVKTWEHVMQQQMLDVFQAGIRLLDDPTLHDNFYSAISLNAKMIRALNNSQHVL